MRSRSSVGIFVWVLFLALHVSNVTGVPVPPPREQSDLLLLEWYKSLGGELTDEARTVDVDANAGVVEGGLITGVVSLNEGEFFLQGQGTDGYVLRRDRSGELLWAWKIGGNFVVGGDAPDYVQRVRIDPNGNVLVAGTFQAPYVTAECATQPDDVFGFENSDAAGTTSDLFVIKFASDGTYKWHMVLGGQGNQAIEDMVVDDQGDFFLSSITTGPEPWAYESDEIIIEASPDHVHSIIAKHNGTDGSVVWVHQLGPDDVAVLSLSFDQGRLYAGGWFQGEALWDLESPLGANSTNPGNRDGFVARINPGTGGFTWIVYVHSVLGEMDAQVEDIAASVATQKLAVVGTYSDEILMGDSAVLGYSGQSEPWMFLALVRDKQELADVPWIRTQEPKLWSMGGSVVFEHYHNQIYTAHACHLTSAAVSKDAFSDLFISNLYSTVCVGRYDPLAGEEIWTEEAQREDTSTTNFVRDLAVGGPFGDEMALAGGYETTLTVNQVPFISNGMGRDALVALIMGYLVDCSDGQRCDLPLCWEDPACTQPTTSPTLTPSPSATVMPSSPMPSPSESISPTPTLSESTPPLPSVSTSPSVSSTPFPSESAPPSASPTPFPSPSVSSTPLPSESASPSASPSVSATVSASPTPTATRTASRTPSPSPSQFPFTCPVIRYFNTRAGYMVLFEQDAEITASLTVNCADYFHSWALGKFGDEPQCIYHASDLSVFFGPNWTLLPGDSTKFTTEACKFFGSHGRLALPEEQKSLSHAPRLSRCICPVSLPESPPQAYAVLNAPASVGACARASLDARASSGGGGIDLIFSWEFVNPRPDSSKDATLAATLSRWTTSLLELAADDLEVREDSYEFAVEVSNVFGSSSRAVAFVNKLPGNGAIFVIENPAEESVTVVGRTSLSIHAALLPMTCGDDYEVQVYPIWTQIDTGGHMVIPSDIEAAKERPELQGFRLMLPASLLVSNETYTFRIQAASPISGLEVVPDTIQVTILPGPIEARIIGGSYRLVSRGEPLVLDATESQDPDDMDGAFTFAWSCSYTNSISDGSSSASDFADLCLVDGVAFEDPHVGQITIPANSFESGLYRFSVLVRKGTREDTAFVVIEAGEDEHPVPNLSIEFNHAERVNQGERLRFIMHIHNYDLHASLHDFTFAWTISPHPEVSDEDTLFSLNRKVLVLPPFTLLPGQMYTISAKAHYTLADVEDGYASLVVQVNQGPSGGDLEVSPSEGVAGEPVVFTTTGWVDLDAPQEGRLDYAFGLAKPEDPRRVRFLQEFRPNPTAERILPFSIDTTYPQSLLAVLMVRSAYSGAITHVTKALVIHPPDIHPGNALAYARGRGDNVRTLVNQGKLEDVISEAQTIATALYVGYDPSSSEDQEERISLRSETVLILVESANVQTSSRSIDQFADTISHLSNQPSELPVSIRNEIIGFLRDLTEAAQEQGLEDSTAQHILSSLSSSFAGTPPPESQEVRSPLMRRRGSVQRQPCRTNMCRAFEAIWTDEQMDGQGAVETANTLARAQLGEAACGEDAISTTADLLGLRVRREYRILVEGSTFEATAADTVEGAASVTLPDTVFQGDDGDADDCVDQIVTNLARDFHDLTLLRNSSKCRASNLTGIDFYASESGRLLRIADISKGILITLPTSSIPLDLDTCADYDNYTHSCEFWTADGWSSEGCRVSEVSDANQTIVCNCTHLTEFGDFLRPEADLPDFTQAPDEDNIFGYIVVGAVLILYIISMIAARRYRRVKLRRSSMRFSMHGGILGDDIIRTKHRTTTDIERRRRIKSMGVTGKWAEAPASQTSSMSGLSGPSSGESLSAEFDAVLTDSEKKRVSIASDERAGIELTVMKPPSPTHDEDAKKDAKGAKERTDSRATLYKDPALQEMKPPQGRPIRAVSMPQERYVEQRKRTVSSKAHDFWESFRYRVRKNHNFLSVFFVSEIRDPHTRFQRLTRFVCIVYSAAMLTAVFYENNDKESILVVGLISMAVLLPANVLFLIGFKLGNKRSQIHGKQSWWIPFTYFCCFLYAAFCAYVVILLSVNFKDALALNWLKAAGLSLALDNLVQEPILILLIAILETAGFFEAVEPMLGACADVLLPAI